MSNNTGTNHQQDQGQQNNNGILNNLLAIATDAQGNRPLDPNVSEMSIENRVWLENALEQLSSDADPVKKLKQWMQRLEEIKEPNETNFANLEDILEEIGDLVCDIDLAQVFCTIGGLKIIQKFLSKGFDPASALFLHLLGVLAQYNSKVQQVMLHEPFMEQCLAIIVDDTKPMDYRHKAVGAISAMVKGYVPGLIRFLQLDGPNKLIACFDSALQTDQQKLAHRCAVAAVALRNSFAAEVLNIDSNWRQIIETPDKMKEKIDKSNSEKDGPTGYKETLEFLTY